MATFYNGVINRFIDVANPRATSHYKKVFDFSLFKKICNLKLCWLFSHLSLRFSPPPTIKTKDISSYFSPNTQI